MGLKITNYEVKAKKHVLPEAYAVIGKMEIDERGSGYAIMHIQATRENALSAEPFETKRVDFFWDRKADIAETIYNAAKVARTVRRMNRETRKMEEVVIDPMFSGWEDDKINDEVNNYVY